MEAACHIPVEFVVFLKWGTSEICFMTRQLLDFIEYQFIYLPLSSCKEDFTVFEWRRDLPQLWDELLSVLETQGFEMTIFKQGPWSLFGITSPEIQARMSSVREKVVGILHCSGWDNLSTFNHYSDYLGLSPDDKNRFDWIITEFMNEELPLNCTRHVSQQNVYWISSNVSTWKHPLYDKYSSLLSAARAQHVMNHWKPITIFQLNFFISQKSETLELLLEICRIFNIEIRNELFLIDVVRRIYKHFTALPEINAETSNTSVDDFARLIDQERNEAKNRTKVLPVIACSECLHSTATVLCCDKFCKPCFDNIHATGRRKHHRWRSIDLEICVDCPVLAAYTCEACKDAFCPECFALAHARGMRQTHVAVCIATPIAPAVAPKTPSPWVKLADASGVPLYVSLVTRAQTRDPPT